MKTIFIFLSVLLISLFVTSTTIAINNIGLQPLYKGEELVFCNMVFRGNYLIVTRTSTPTSFSEYYYKVRYLVYSKNTYKIIFFKDLGRGVYSHIVSGTLTQPNNDRTNNKKTSSDADLFIWIEGQASNAFLFHATESDISILFEGGEFRAKYSCQDIDNDGIYEILQYDSTWHALDDDDTRKKWAKQMSGHPFAKLIYKFNGSKYVLYEIVPDCEAERE